MNSLTMNAYTQPEDDTAIVCEHCGEPGHDAYLHVALAAVQRQADEVSRWYAADPQWVECPECEYGQHLDHCYDGTDSAGDHYHCRACGVTWREADGVEPVVERRAYCEDGIDEAGWDAAMDDIGF